MNSPDWPLSPQSFAALATGLDGPEGIVWDRDRGVLYAGGRRGQLYRLGLDGTWQELLQLEAESFVLGLALDSAGRIYVCERGNGRLLRVDPHSLKVENYATGTQDRPLVTPNYPAFASDGTLFLSDSGTWGDNNGVVFKIAADRSSEVWTRVPSDFTNGIALSPAGDALYVAESRGSRVWRIPVAADGSAGEPTSIWHLPQSVPDGLAFDVAGRLYVSLYRPDAIYCIDVKTGSSELVVYDWSAQYLMAPTNIAFVGDDLDVLVTANLAGDHIAVLQTPLPAHGLLPNRPVLD